MWAESVIEKALFVSTCFMILTKDLDWDVMENLKVSLINFWEIHQRRVN